jgi:hypothetical protein
MPKAGGAAESVEVGGEEGIWWRLSEHGVKAAVGAFIFMFRISNGEVIGDFFYTIPVVTTESRGLLGAYFESQGFHVITILIPPKV